MFTDSLASEGEQVNIALAVTQLGQRLGLDLVAEGVEQESQVQALLRLGCPIAQGFFFAGPLPTEEIDRLMRCASIAAWKAHERGPTPEIGAPQTPVHRPRRAQATTRPSSNLGDRSRSCERSRRASLPARLIATHRPVRRECSARCFSTMSRTTTRRRRAGGTAADRTGPRPREWPEQIAPDACRSSPRARRRRGAGSHGCALRASAARRPCRPSSPVGPTRSKLCDVSISRGPCSTNG